MRKCELCGIDDRPHLSGEDCKCNHSGTIIGHHEDCPAVHHYVAPDWVILRNELEFSQRKLAAKGYTYKAKHGRHVAERLICRQCIRKETEKRLMRADYEDQAKKAEHGTSKTMYQILCG